MSICTAGKCEADALPGSPAPLCERHARHVALWYSAKVRNELGPAIADDISDRHVADVIAFHEYKQRGELQQLPERAAPTQGQRVVYFAKVGEYIKIGTTQNLDVRMQQIGASELLHAEPGTYDSEAAMHRKFTHLLRYGREYFEDGPEIRNFLTVLKATLA